MHGNVLLCAFQFTALHDKLLNLFLVFFPLKFLEMLWNSNAYSGCKW